MADVAALTWPLTRPGGQLYVPRNRIRRVLFGPPDPERSKLRLEEEMRRVNQQNMQRWNFDFENERPLNSGRYVWMKVGGEDPSPPDADSNGGSVEEDSGEKSPSRQEQTQITDFMRKRKSSNQKDSITLRSKTRRRSST